MQRKRRKKRVGLALATAGTFSSPHNKDLKFCSMSLNSSSISAVRLQVLVQGVRGASGKRSMQTVTVSRRSASHIQSDSVKKLQTRPT